MSDWTPVSEPPKASGFYLLASGSKVSVGRYMTKKAEWKLPPGWSGMYTPSHWMPLPPPPKEP